ncbi:ABC transporter permease DevC [Pseudanabaena sp. PCC 6802]|uniref:ABC transporter permease DevC n=1 Tax=Pseudanabaena sp. PCC 6802 TaxID=118173 RepID=UPI00034A7D8C|nr:ABC transporter permease DevC [Pseudanabaena sp. PCC 6802]
MKTPLAWLNLMHERTRLLVAIAGVAFADILVFTNLGFLGSLPATAGLVYNQIDADIYLVSPQALEITSGRAFPIQRIYQAAGVEGVERVMPLYTGRLQWRNSQTHLSRSIFVYGINPNDPVFKLPELRSPANQAALRSWDTVLIDRKSRPEFGPKDIGHTTEAKRRQVKIGGQFTLGGGMSADGSLIMSDQNFRRYFNPSPLNRINMGLIKLKPGADATQIASVLRKLLPPDVAVLTQQQIIQRDSDFWVELSSTGFIFGMGVAVSCMVGAVIVYQILYTDIANHMKQYATLKAMGYHNRYLLAIVLEEAIILAVLGYIPGLALSLGLYELTVRTISLPMFMDLGRVIYVLLLTIAMCAASGLASMQKVISADPAEVF